MTPVKLLFDEDVDHRILRGLRRAQSQVDVRTVTDVGVGARSDAEVLALAAAQERLLVSQDVNTMTAEHSEFVRAGNRSAGIVFVPRDISIGDAVRDLVLICEASTAEEWVNRIDFLPI